MKITIEATIKRDIKTVWAAWNTPEDINQWNAASDDWHTTSSSVDLREGGKFCARMEAKEGSMGFDFEGVYTNVIEHKLIEYVMGDGRRASTTFKENNGAVTVTTTFDAESEHPAEMQRQGWQAILDNFVKYVEASA